MRTNENILIINVKNWVANIRVWIYRVSKFALFVASNVMNQTSMYDDWMFDAFVSCKLHNSFTYEVIELKRSLRSLFAKILNVFWDLSMILLICNDRVVENCFLNVLTSSFLMLRNCFDDENCLSSTSFLTIV